MGEGPSFGTLSGDAGMHWLKAWSSGDEEPARGTQVCQRE